MLDWRGVRLPKWVHLPNMNTLLNLLLLHRGLFYERPVNDCLKNNDNYDEENENVMDGFIFGGLLSHLA